MVKVVTYIKLGDDIVPTRDVVPAPSFTDEEPVHGAISLKVGERELLGCDLIDRVDELWVFLLQGIYQVYEGSMYESYFPTRSITFRFDSSAPRDELDFELHIRGRGVLHERVHKRELIRPMADEARRFFSLMEFVKPTEAVIYDFYRQMAEELLEQI